MKQLYVINYQNPHWCGGQSSCVAWAENPDQAVTAANDHMEEDMRELFSQEYEEESKFEEESAYTVDSVDLLVGSRFEEWYNDGDQRNAFYPCVNPEDASHGSEK